MKNFKKIFRVVATVALSMLFFSAPISILAAEVSGTFGGALSGSSTVSGTIDGTAGGAVRSLGR